MEPSTSRVRLPGLSDEEDTVGPNRQILPRRLTQGRQATARRSIRDPDEWLSHNGSGYDGEINTEDGSEENVRAGSSYSEFSPEEESSSQEDKTRVPKRAARKAEQVRTRREGQAYRQESNSSQTSNAAETVTTSDFMAEASVEPEPTTPPPDPLRTRQAPRPPAKAANPSFIGYKSTAHEAPVRRKYSKLKISNELNRYKAKEHSQKLNPVEKTQFTALNTLDSMLTNPSNSKTAAVINNLPSMKQILKDSKSAMGDGGVPTGPSPYYRVGPRPRLKISSSKDTGRDETSRKRERDVTEPTERPSHEQPTKRRRTRTRPKARIPVDLALPKPQPARLTFPPHPPEERSDEWYIAQFEELFNELDDFVEEFFTIHNLDQDTFHQLWALDMTPEFLNYVEQVAEPDINQGGWDAIIQNTKQRKLLIKAVLMRILEVKVFGAELLGAAPEEDEMMMRLEKGLFTQERFVRQQLRSQQVRTILGFSCITKDFHSAVAKLTAQITLLLQPLSEYLYALPPTAKKDSPRKLPSNPTIQEQNQALHNLISKAGYLSIAIRLSSTIFFFDHANPGDHWEDEEHISVDEEIYNASKTFFERPYEAAVNSLKVDYEVLAAQLRATEPGLTLMEEPKTEAGRAIAVQMKAMREDTQKPIPPNYTHRALVKISILPNIRRFKPGGQIDDETNAPLHTRKGFRVREICKAQVLCYFGDKRILSTGERLESLDLHHFVEHKKSIYRRGEAVSSWSKWVAAGATGAVLGAAGLRYLGAEPDFLTDKFPSMNLRNALLGNVW